MEMDEVRLFYLGGIYGLIGLDGMGWTDGYWMEDAFLTSRFTRYIHSTWNFTTTYSVLLIYLPMEYVRSTVHMYTCTWWLETP